MESLKNSEIPSGFISYFLFWGFKGAKPPYVLYNYIKNQGFLMEKIKLYVVSLGCPKNLVDTEKIIGSLKEIYTLVDSPEEAKLIIINTCAFIKNAVEESIDTILEIAIPAKKKDSPPYIVVTGCLVSRYEKELKKEIPEVDLFLPIANQKELKNIIANIFKETLMSYQNELSAMGLRPLEPPKIKKNKNKLTENQKKALFNQSFLKTNPSKDSNRFISTPPSYGYVKIAEGCNHACSFCIIPKLRGKLISFSSEEIIKDAKHILSTGRKEIILVAQDLTSYGLDRGEKKAIYRLLEQMAKLKNLFWLRLLYLYPKGITEDFIRFLKGISPPFVPYFDVPMQHSHPEILKKMGRPFRVQGEKIVSLIRKYFEDAAIRTSLIVGFPGEEKRHFDHLVEFVKRTQFTHVGVFTYSREERSKAAMLENQVPEDVKIERKKLLMEIQRDISRNFLKHFEHKKLKILIDKKNIEWPTLYEGRAWFFAPEIDGVVYVSGEDIKPGDIKEVLIEDTYDYDLAGIVI